MPAEESEPLALDQVLGARLAVILGERRLVVEELKLRRRADHVQEDHILGARQEMRLPSGLWTSRDRFASRFLAEQPR
jgi:hypothetical protein